MQSYGCNRPLSRTQCVTGVLEISKSEPGFSPLTHSAAVAAVQRWHRYRASELGDLSAAGLDTGTIESSLISTVLQLY